MPKYFFIFFLFVFSAVSAPGSQASAQTQSPPESPTAAAERDAALERELHLTTIGAFSAGIALQSYGYIGSLADLMSKEVYPPELVISMLSETISYLRNINTQLRKYQNNQLVATSDRRFMVSMTEIVDQLIAEAEALSSFAKTKNADDLKRFDEARKNAWKNIKKTFNMR